ncbi:MAG: lytic transglycosylase domain-containing protein [Cryobacterium sp.]|nr:lytic transglycosylase domain-containing protein [Oligoflexia bacterium]
MKYLRLTSFWGMSLWAAAWFISLIFPFSHSTEAMIYPVRSLYQGGAYATLTETTLERVFSDRMSGKSELYDLTGKSGLRDRSNLSKRLAAHLYQLCLQNRLDPAFILSVIQAESRFQLDAESPAGAIGLMQLMPGTARVVAAKHPTLLSSERFTANDLRDPFLNLTLGVVYLKEMKDRYTGLSPYYHLAAYNMGPGSLDALMAGPDFRPEKTLKYYQGIMRGVSHWRHYQGRHSKVSTTHSGALGIKPISDVARNSPNRKI